MHATIPKGIVGGFEFTILQRNLQEWHKRPWTYVCDCERKATKVGSTAQVSGTEYWSYPISPLGIVACTFFPTTFLEIAVSGQKYCQQIYHAWYKSTFFSNKRILFYSKTIEITLVWLNKQLPKWTISTLWLTRKTKRQVMLSVVRQKEFILK